MGEDKLWINVAGKPVLAWTLHAVTATQLFARVVVVAPLQRWVEIRKHCGELNVEDVRVVEGGGTRQLSVAAGLRETTGVDIVCVHDGARPLCPSDVFRATVLAARRHGAATAAIPPADCIKIKQGEFVQSTLLKSSLVAAQTPQAFRRDTLVEAHAQADDDQAEDDCVLVERCGGTVCVVSGSRQNIKLTHPVDIELLRAVLEKT